MSVVVGEIQGYPVQYVPEKDMVFCKNTVCKVKDIERLVYKSPMEREYLAEKDLSIVKLEKTVQFGCLSTSLDNVSAIRDAIRAIRRGK